MKRIILQHWTGDIPEIVRLSSANIRKYAEKTGADYRLLRGNIFRKNLAPPCQKLFMLDESLDDYDVVVMLDPDMFTAAWLDRDIFDETGIGMEHVHTHRRLLRKLPALSSKHHPCWGGAVYRLEREMRQRLRSHVAENELPKFNNYSKGCDEGIMHRLAVLAKVPLEGAYLSDQWCYGSNFPAAEKALVWHIRGKTSGGRKMPKIRIYQKMVKFGKIVE